MILPVKTANITFLAHVSLITLIFLYFGLNSLPYSNTKCASSIAITVISFTTGYIILLNYSVNNDSGVI